MNFTVNDARDLFDAVESLPMTLGVFDHVGTHEPLNAPGNGLHLSLTLGPVTPAPSGLNSTSLRITFLARIYSSLMQRPLDPVDPNLLGATYALLGAYNGSFTLGGLARNIDVLTASAAPAYLRQDGKEFRVMEVTLPVIVNDAFDQEA